MRVAGIVAEYNPFHLGHEYQIAETRRALGEDTAVVCAMSGNWVQRGEAAVMSKWSRAECALRGGADLVLELPTAWATASAEGFARGAVALLAAAGVVDAISFGCEDGRLSDLQATAEALLTGDYRQALRAELDAGTAFALARQRAAFRLVGGASDCLRKPNNNLAVEYLKALRALGEPMEPVAVPRRGAAHDAAEAEAGFASASAIRKRLFSEDWEGAAAYLPGGTAEVCSRERVFGRAPASLQSCERAVLARLRAMDGAAFGALPDAGEREGLPRRMTEAARSGLTMEEVCLLAKTKRYAMSRIRRLVLWSFLGLTAADRPASPPYIRVLGMSKQGRTLLRRMEQACALPVVVKPAHAKRLDGEGRRLFESEARYTDLYALCTPVSRPCGLEWVNGPIILR